MYNSVSIILDAYRIKLVTDNPEIIWMTVSIINPLEVEVCIYSPNEKNPDKEDPVLVYRHELYDVVEPCEGELLPEIPITNFSIIDQVFERIDIILKEGEASSPDKIEARVWIELAQKIYSVPFFASMLNTTKCYTDS